MKDQEEKRKKEVEEKRIKEKIEKERQDIIDTEERLKQQQISLKKYELKQEKAWEEFNLQYPTKKEKDAIFDQDSFKVLYTKDQKGCFHELGDQKITHSSEQAVTTDYQCKKCGIVQAEEVCSPWHDGSIIYKDVKFKKSLDDFESKREKYRKLKEWAIKNEKMIE